MRTYIYSRRMERAMTLLHDTEDSVTAIDAGSGFENVYYFSRLFYNPPKRHKGFRIFVLNPLSTIFLYIHPPISSRKWRRSFGSCLQMG